VLNLEKTRFAKFITQRVMNFSPRLKMPRKTRETSIRHTLCAESFGTDDLPRKALPPQRIRHSLSAELEASIDKSYTARGQFQSIAPIHHTACAEFTLPFHPSLSWSHYRAIMRVEKPEAREFYEQEAFDKGEPEIQQGVKELKGMLK
jgi:hypothetical protein